MSQFHLSVKPRQRSAGRSATAGAAYAAGVRIVDARTGEIHDYTKKGGVDAADGRLYFPVSGVTQETISDFWNRVELHHRRGDAVTARGFDAALPLDLSHAQRVELGQAFASEISSKYGVAVQVDFHQPHRVTKQNLARNPEQFFVKTDDGSMHNGNFHVHVLMSGCTVEKDGRLGKKCVELDPIHCQRHGVENFADWGRARWADMTNAALERAGVDVRVDHRSNAERGLAAMPTVKIGHWQGAHSRAKRNELIKSGNSKLAEARNELAVLNNELAELDAFDAAERRQITREIMSDRWALITKQRAEVAEARSAEAAERDAAARARAAAELREQHELEKAKFLQVEKQRFNTLSGDDFYVATADIRDFKATAAGDLVNYGRGSRVEFVDYGKRVELVNEDDATVLAALQLAAAKFPAGITVTGDAVFKQRCLELAKTHGFKLKNKDLADQLQQHKAAAAQASAWWASLLPAQKPWFAEQAKTTDLAKMYAWAQRYEAEQRAALNQKPGLRRNSSSNYKLG